MKEFKWRGVIIIIVTAVSLILLLPTFSSYLPSGVKKLLPKRQIKLGLDLKGGIHLIFNIDMDKAMESRINILAQEIKEKLAEEGITEEDIKSGQVLKVILPDASTQGIFRDVINSQFPDLEVISSGEGGDGKYSFELTLKETEKKILKERAASLALETIRNRIDQFGVTEPLIARQGESEIVVQLPGIKTDAEKEQAKRLIGRTALLEFKVVDDSLDLIAKLADKLPENIYLTYETIEDKSGARKSVSYLRSSSISKLQEFLNGKIPDGYQIFLGETFEKDTRVRSFRTYLIKKDTLLTGEMLTDARARFDRFPPYVGIKFNSAGADRFFQITKAHVGERLAIVLDDKVYSAPRIKEVISGGSAVIEGSFTDEEAKLLAIVLRSGALPAPLKMIGEISVGPTLGKDSIDKGLFASLVGGLAVIAFMLFYYSFSGIIASIALVLNVLIILAIMGALEGTLTLPGIAGIALTIGMAVDANVLIFERIKEELKVGKTPRAAVDAGFDKAFNTIFDSNLTTIVAALALFLFGSGPIKGFGITLTLGLIANIFTSVFVCKTIYDYLLQKRKIKTISI
ncbi:MAG TPA: protein translocase subunit SecD [bacterium]